MLAIADSKPTPTWNLADSKPTPTWAWVFNLGINMNIELEEVVGLDVSDDALEQAAGGPLGGVTRATHAGWGTPHMKGC